MSDAHVAAALEQAAARLENLRDLAAVHGFKAEVTTYCCAIDTVRALITEDQRSALDAYVRRAVEEERERCAKIAQREAENFAYVAGSD